MIQHLNAISTELLPLLIVEFEEYLSKKKIDGQAFKTAEPDRYSEWLTLFGQLSEQSFTAQKLYLINAVRRKYTIQDSSESTTKASTAAKPKPIIKSRPKFN